MSATVDEVTSVKQKSQCRFDVAHRKLPKPIVFWSDNERDAFRRNRVVQTRLNMIMDDISNQRETTKKTIRFEAHKFRQKNSRYLQVPGKLSMESLSSGVISYITIRPDTTAEQTPREEQTPRFVENADDFSGDDDDDNESSASEPRRKGIITRRKRSVKFSAYRNIKVIENHSDEEDVREIYSSTPKNGFFESGPHVRSWSADAYRSIPELRDYGQRQQSALPVIRNEISNACGAGRGVSKNTKMMNTSWKDNGKVFVVSSLRSDTFFDKSKAAYQLRQELRRQARLRKQGVTRSAFTIQDALTLERDRYANSREKVLDYLTRLEIEKRKIPCNRWTRKEIESTLNL